MPTFRQHIPGFVDGCEPEIATFQSAEELLALSVVERYREDPNRGFHRFSIARQSRGPSLLMVERDDGRWWWVVGYIDDATGIDLPEWFPVEDQSLT